ncbi:hypothetical protein ACJMK2_028068 [Sinanodonta woodiana]|uniref:NADH dehydrogenase [ubiquinone] 1 beta subcomplex subunit 4 n=1 Tax=Sinanodonta woodiana TaxID=1069815 RepID=A0ABD3X849_SINWO
MSEQKRPMTWDPWKTFDISQAEKEAIAIRAQNRKVLKVEWQKKVTDPFAGGEGGHVFDPMVQRFNSMKATAFDHFRITPKSTWVGAYLFFIPLAGLIYLVHTTRTERERKYRSGEIPYEKRTFRFVY